MLIEEDKKAYETEKKENVFDYWGDKNKQGQKWKEIVKQSIYKKMSKSARLEWGVGAFPTTESFVIEFAALILSDFYWLKPLKNNLPNRSKKIRGNPHGYQYGEVHKVIFVQVGK